MPKRLTFVVLPLMCAALAAIAAPSTATTRATRHATSAQPAVPYVSHVWQIVLENEEEPTSFPGTGTELDKLAAQGVFVPNYYGTGHASLDNYIAMVSGQAQFTSTSQDCPYYHDAGGTVDAKGFYQPMMPQDTGCVVPSSVLTLGDQMSAAGLGWRGYMEDMGNTSTRETSPCGQPAVGGVAVNPVAGGPDQTEGATAADQYAARHNPFVYFHSLIDAPANGGTSLCTRHVRPFSRFAADLKQRYPTRYTFITPNLCDDGHDSPCRGPGAEGANPGAGGLVSANAFIAKVVPLIQASPAYRKHGLILITFDEGSSSKACCGESAFSTGGGKVGAVLLGPDLHAHTSSCAYNHFSLLRTWEDLFRLTPSATHGIKGSDGHGHLAHAGDAAAGTLLTELTTTTDPCAPH